MLLLAVVLISPKILSWSISQNTDAKALNETASVASQDFPVTVDPKQKLITENDQVNEYLATNHSLLGAAVATAGDSIWNLFKNIAISIANAPWYQSLANVSSKFVTINAGMRKEQVAAAFGDALKWNNKQRKSFMSSSGLASTSPFSSSIPDGSFSPGIYDVALGMTPETVRQMIDNRFSDEVLSHYSSTTQSVVPLKDALTVASLIQRETITTDGMRLLSGIIWNRLFTNMNLQIDSTLQYVKANTPTEEHWWPNVNPADKYLRSPYNTYTHPGLPPTPIANPSVAAILAALNPIKTPCIFYFNDKSGAFHCSVTYAEHVSELKKYY